VIQTVAEKAGHQSQIFGHERLPKVAQLAFFTESGNTVGAA